MAHDANTIILRQVLDYVTHQYQIVLGQLRGAEILDTPGIDIAVEVWQMGPLVIPIALNRIDSDGALLRPVCRRDWGVAPGRPQDTRG